MVWLKLFASFYGEHMRNVFIFFQNAYFCQESDVSVLFDFLKNQLNLWHNLRIFM